MIMKKIFYPLFAAALMLSACTTNFLEVEPTTTVPEETSYATEYDITKALMAAYAPLIGFDYCDEEFHPYQFMSDIMADDYNAVGGSGPSDIVHLQLISNFNLNSQQSPVGFWTNLYRGVYRSNIVVNRTAAIEGMSDANKTRVINEARFLRAFYYHILWKFWGSVPYYTENPNGADVAYIVPQLSEDEVYNKIMEDLDAATAPGALPETVLTTEVGRANRYAAYMLRAEVVMLKGDESRYASVLSQLQELINSNIYELTPNFADIWETEGEWNCESIFEINYADDPSNRSWDDPLAPGGSIYPVFLCPDSYKGSRFHEEGYGFGPVSAALKAAYEEGDQRRDASIMDFNTDKQAGEKFNERYGNTGMFNKKYMARAGGAENNVAGIYDMGHRNNLRIYRYSDALLRAAELIIRTGGSQADADAYLNKVRARAFNVEPENIGTNKKTAPLDNILDERRKEFAMEGHRFFDLVRFGKADAVLGAKGYSASKRYIPIPQSEIDKAEGTLKQNNY